MVPKNNQAKTHRQLFPQTIFLRRFSSDNFFLQATFLQILFFLFCRQRWGDREDAVREVRDVNRKSQARPFGWPTALARMGSTS
jgi:hypothetical protein